MSKLKVQRQFLVVKDGARKVIEKIDVTDKKDEEIISLVRQILSNVEQRFVSMETTAQETPELPN